MIDKRLLGTWELDSRKTLHEARRWRDVPQAKRKKPKRRRAKMRVRVTRTRTYLDLAGDKSVEPYRVVAKDASSVAIVTPKLDDTGEIEVMHIHFEGRYFWVWHEGANFPAYYRRIK
jgi:hypothetical protein